MAYKNQFHFDLLEVRLQKPVQTAVPMVTGSQAPPLCRFEDQQLDMER
jgi:hypothetical protein